MSVFFVVVAFGLWIYTSNNKHRARDSKILYTSGFSDGGGRLWDLSDALLLRNRCDVKENVEINYICHLSTLVLSRINAHTFTVRAKTNGIRTTTTVQIHSIIRNNANVSQCSFILRPPLCLFTPSPKLTAHWKSADIVCLILTQSEHTSYVWHSSCALPCDVSVFNAIGRTLMQPQQQQQHQWCYKRVKCNASLILN